MTTTGSRDPAQLHTLTGVVTGKLGATGRRSRRPDGPAPRPAVLASAREAVLAPLSWGPLPVELVEQERAGHEALCAAYRRRPAIELLAQAATSDPVKWAMARAARRVLAERRLELVTACGAPTVAERRWRCRVGLA